MDEITLKAIEKAVEKAFSAGVDDKRFIDVSRVPLICQSIVGIEKRLTAIDEKMDTKLVSVEAFSPVQKIVYGMVGLILIAVVGALISLVIMK